MSRLRELIEQLCPDGVEYKTLGDFAECFSGATPKKKVKEYWNNGTIPWMSSGEVHQRVVRSVEGRITEAGYGSCSTRMVPVGTIVVALAGQGKTRGCVAITAVELCTNQSLGAILPDDTVVNKFLYYYLDTQYHYLRQISSGEGTRGGLNMPMLRELRIPIPPIEVQREIVRILDSMQELDDALSESIKFRAKQLDAARKALTDDSCFSDEKTTALKNVVTFGGGHTPSKADASNYAVGQEGINWMTSKEVKKEQLDSSLITLTKKGASDLKLYKPGTIVMVTRSGILRHHLPIAQLREPSTVNQDLKTIVAKDGVDQDYLFAVLMARADDMLRRFHNIGGTVDSIVFDRVKNMEVPIPSIEMQHSVVGKLKLMADLIECMKGELQARRKQFEYYRDKLLDFPEKVA